MKKNVGLILILIGTATILTLGCSNPAGSSAGGTGTPGTPPPSSFTMDLTDETGSVPEGAALEDYGFDGVAYVFINAEGDIESTGPGGWEALPTFTTPDFLIDRNDENGVEVTWAARYPETSGVRWKENNKTWIRLLDEQGNTILETLYKPNGSSSEAHSWDLSLSDQSGTLETATTGLVTGDSSSTPANDAEWIDFRLVIEPTVAAGGSGSISLYFNGEETPRISRLWEAATQFHGLHFEYKTGTADSTFAVQVRGLSIDSTTAPE